ncbi:MAG: hypothetical protein JW966_05850 [Anaerolineae bacterium]|nr:hypothetical protein [Anaerolineae bacterium]
MSKQDRGKQTSGGTSRRKRFKITAALALLAGVSVIVLVLFVALRDAPDPTGESAGQFAQDIKPDFTEGAGWPPGIAAPEHTLPAMIKNALSAVSEQHGYQFRGRAGQTWRISVSAQPDSTVDPVVSVYGPAGGELANNDDRAADDLDAHLVFTLPTDGAYRLLVESSEGGITTGAYLLSVFIDSPTP